MRTERYELRDVEPAAGRWRGGIGIIRANRFLSDGAFTSETDRAYEPPPGLFGGGTGRTLRLYRIDPQGVEEELESKQTNFAMPAGTTLVWEQACGGGYGDPFERDPGLVLRDWREELVSAASAERDYGVVIDVAADAVDEEATARRRGARGSETRGG
jgi:N-methylhydantoinase B/oxoprolinase/acetone carboxylase alpha subunit